MTAKKTYTEVGHVSKHIRDMLDRCGLHKCKVKAVALSPLKEQPSCLEAKVLIDICSELKMTQLVKDPTFKILIRCYHDILPTHGEG